MSSAAGTPDDESAVPDGIFAGGEDDAFLKDYLYKMTRDGRWQRRWFETNGIFLTYYKSRKREKLLAALSLLQVGEIKSVAPPEDADANNREGWFTIQLNSRVYTLRARSNTEAERWVAGLIQIKEANPDTGEFLAQPCSIIFLLFIIIIHRSHNIAHERHGAQPILQRQQRSAG